MITLRSRTDCRRTALTISAALLVTMSPITSPVRAQSTSPVLWTADSIHSQVLGETRHLRLALPIGYDARDNAMERYPVLIVLDADGEAGFTATAANVRALSGRSGVLLPRLIVVGVESRNTRYHDMTPPPDDSKNNPDAGGAPKFLQFLATELRPYIAAHYRTRSSTVLAGHSLAGLFTVWAFGQAPEFLTGAIALSPSRGLVGLKGADRQVVEGFTARATPGRLFTMTSASEGGLDTAIRALAETLKARPRPGRVFEYQQITEASHVTTGLVGMVPGLRFVFRPVSLDGLVWYNDGSEPSISRLIVSFDSARAAYVRGAQEFDLPPRLPQAWLVNQSGDMRDPRMAPLRLRLCDALIDFYPTLWNGFDCAGDAQVQLGRRGDAAVNYRRAVEAARTAGDSATADRLMRKEQGLRAPLRPPPKH